MIPDTRIFLSHSSRDKVLARRLAEDLRRHGAAVWLDEEALAPGSRWRRELRRAVVAHDFVVLLISPEAIASTWVAYEIDQALAQGKKEGRVKLVPALVRNCTIPAKLRPLQRVDLRGGAYPRGLKRLVALCARSWTRPRHARRPWSKRNLRLALRTGILREFDGRLVFGARVAERSRIYGGRWLRGRPIALSDHPFRDWKEYAGLSLLHAVDPKAGLTAAQELALVQESHARLLDFYLDLATRAGVLDEQSHTLRLAPAIGDEMQAWLPRLGELGFIEEARGDLRAAVTMLFVELIRERLIARIPEMTSFAEALGIVIHHHFGFWKGWNGSGEDPPGRDERAVSGGEPRGRRRRAPKPAGRPEAAPRRRG